MSETLSLDAQPRQLRGRHLGSLRRAGQTPAVLYGKGIEPLSLQVDTKSFLKVAQQAGHTGTIHLSVEGEKGPRAVRIQALQQHVTRLSPLHIDFISA